MPDRAGGGGGGYDLGGGAEAGGAGGARRDVVDANGRKVLGMSILCVWWNGGKDWRRTES